MTIVIADVAGTPEPPGGSPSEPATKIAGRSPRALAWSRLKQDRLSLVCIGFILLVVAAAIFAHPLSQLIGQSPYKPDRGPHGLTPDGIPIGPSSHHWLGTDDQGRDILSRLMFGAQVSMIVGLAATAIEIALGLVIGLVAGFYGGRVDSFLSRFMDVVLSFPFLLTALALATRFGNHLFITIGVIAFFSWSQPGRLVRGQVLALREREFVEAARSLGSSNLRIMFVDILPNLIAPVLIYGTLLIPVNIVAESTLSFLGLGVTIPKASWGQMLSDASGGGLYQVAWWFLVFPGLALLLTTLAFNLLGDGLRDALDPRFDRIGKRRGAAT